MKLNLFVNVAQHLLVTRGLVGHFRVLPVHLHPLLRLVLGKLFLNLPLLPLQLLKVALHLFEEDLIRQQETNGMNLVSPIPPLPLRSSRK